ncbi:JAB domain-containing protein [Spirosoma sp. BT702]|uniref:JAB domain-containing protein n=1 Tax=Spirosoma profusum TaxID=2771354 RepID=A0A927G9P6_9BACT|nr:JAB domain-containing protein [Spirosoma profusum]MBD2704827.1 JAB domain-containing protein [Spirosoma profusum]
MSQLAIQSLFTVNEVEISYRNKTPYQDRIQITRSLTAYEILHHAWDENKLELLEQFKILLLDRKNNCLAISDIATGGMTACIVDPKVIFVTALQANAAGIILAHNHPSGNLQPSDQDLALTRKLSECGKLLDIAILDHLIVTPRNYYSFADEGCMPR